MRARTWHRTRPRGTLCCCDFNEISGREEPFAEGFDLAISTMSPAIHDAATVEKNEPHDTLMVLYGEFLSEWRQPLRDALMKEIGIEPRPKHTGDLKADCAALIQAVTDAGYVPQVKYVDYNWSDKRGAEGMAEYMRRNYFADELNADALCAAALERLKDICDADGNVNDEINTKVAWIYLEKPEREHDKRAV